MPAPKEGCLTGVSQLSFHFIKGNRLLHRASRIQKSNFSRTKTSAAFRITERLILNEKHRLNAGAFKNLPAVPPRFDLNDRGHRKADGPKVVIFSQCNIAIAGMESPVSLSRWETIKVFQTRKNAQVKIAYPEKLADLTFSGHKGDFIKSVKGKYVSITRTVNTSAFQSLQLRARHGGMTIPILW